jgi:biopolymer transport protein ExbD
MHEPKGVGKAQTEPNVTPLADVTMTLIIVFLIAVPALIWEGLPVDPAQAAPQAAAARETTLDGNPEGKLIVIALTETGITVNGEETPFDELGPLVAKAVAGPGVTTVVVEPVDSVSLDVVVWTLDVAKGAGATKVALLDRSQPEKVTG